MTASVPARRYAHGGTNDWDEKAQAALDRMAAPPVPADRDRRIAVDVDVFAELLATQPPEELVAERNRDRRRVEELEEALGDAIFRFERIRDESTDLTAARMASDTADHLRAVLASGG